MNRTPPGIRDETPTRKGWTRRQTDGHRQQGTDRDRLPGWRADCQEGWARRLGDAEGADRLAGWLAGWLRVWLVRRAPSFPSQTQERKMRVSLCSLSVDSKTRIRHQSLAHSPAPPKTRPCPAKASTVEAPLGVRQDTTHSASAAAPGCRRRLCSIPVGAANFLSRVDTAASFLPPFHLSKTISL